MAQKKNKGGRPSQFDDPEVMQEKIDEYFEKAEVPSMSGLSRHLGFNSRQSLYNYENQEKFLDTVKKARLRVEEYFETQLIKSGGAGAIFWLKNFGWHDKQEHEVTQREYIVGEEDEE